MVKCPSCENNIEHLIWFQEATNIVEIWYNKEEDYMDEKWKESVPGEEQTFACPDCDFVICYTYEDGEKFLKGEKIV